MFKVNKSIWLILNDRKINSKIEREKEITFHIQINIIWDIKGQKNLLSTK